MDTAQRGMGLDWPTSLELIRRSLDAARDHPGALVASGCGTDHLAFDASTTVDDVIRAYEEQMEAIESLGGRLIVMASRALARVATERGRLRARLRPHPDAVEAAGDPALARRHVRSGAGRLLGQRRRRHGDGDGARRHRRQPGQGRRHQDLAARQGQGDRDAAAPARRRPHVHRRRLQLRRADRRRRRRRRARTSSTATPCSASSTRSRRRRARRWRR